MKQFRRLIKVKGYEAKIDIPNATMVKIASGSWGENAFNENEWALNGVNNLFVR